MKTKKKIAHTKANMIELFNALIESERKLYESYSDDEKEYKHFCIIEKSAYETAIKIISDKTYFDKLVKEHMQVK